LPGRYREQSRHSIPLSASWPDPEGVARIFQCRSPILNSPDKLRCNDNAPSAMRPNDFFTPVALPHKCQFIAKASSRTITHY
jgi:hypothetical protein